MTTRSKRAAAKAAAPALGPTEPKSASEGPAKDHRIEVKFGSKWCAGTVQEAAWPEYVVQYDDGDLLQGRLSKPWRMAKPPPKADPAPEEEDDNQEWEVERILKQRQTGGSVEYLVQWTAGDTTWEPQEHVDGLDALKAFLAAGRPARASKRAADDDFVFSEDEESSEDESDEEDYYNELTKEKLARAEAKAKKEAAAYVMREANKENGANVPAGAEVITIDDVEGSSQLSAEQQARREVDGFVMLPIDKQDERATWEALERLLETDKRQLGTACRDSVGGKHDGLRLSSAWKIDHDDVMQKYEAGLKRVGRETAMLEKKGALRRPAPGLPVKTIGAAAALGAASAPSTPLRAEANEQLLLHGTNPSALLSMVSQGLNERLSGSNAGTAFGDGIYLAEDVGKCDQYVSCDPKLNPKDELHQRLYNAQYRHQGSVYYVLVCRCALGAPIRTRQSGQNAVAEGGGGRVFPTSFRELAPVSGISPPVYHHSLIVERGEVIFHGEFVRPEYLIAYQRTAGGAALGKPSVAAGRKAASSVVPPPAPAAAASSGLAVSMARAMLAATAATAAPAVSAPPQPSKSKKKKQKKAKAPKDFSFLVRSKGGFYLPHVPARNTDDVYEAGGRYDTGLYGGKEWFAPRSADLSRFARWMPKGSVEQLNADLLARLERPAGGTYLQVPWADKEAAKQQGARWDGEERLWYVPAGEPDIAKFGPWLPPGAASELSAAAHAAKAARLAQAQQQAQAVRTAQAATWQAQLAAAAPPPAAPMPMAAPPMPMAAPIPQPVAPIQVAAPPQPMAAPMPQPVAPPPLQSDQARIAQMEAELARLRAAQSQPAPVQPVPQAPPASSVPVVDLTGPSSYAPSTAVYAPAPGNYVPVPVQHALPPAYQAPPPQQPPPPRPPPTAGATWLNCPFGEKDMAKALGAKFDYNGCKKWYVPAGMDPTPFARWL